MKKLLMKKLLNDLKKRRLLYFSKRDYKYLF